MHRPPEQLPDPWLFDSEKLLRELDRCREMVLLIPATNHETHFAINIAINAIWNLREDLRYLLHLHREGQRAFAKKHNEALSGKRTVKATTTSNEPARTMKRRAPSLSKRICHPPAA